MSRRKILGIVFTGLGAISELLYFRMCYRKMLGGSFNEFDWMVNWAIFWVINLALIAGLTMLLSPAELHSQNKSKKGLGIALTVIGSVAYFLNYFRIFWYHRQFSGIPLQNFICFVAEVILIIGLVMLLVSTGSNKKLAKRKRIAGIVLTALGTADFVIRQIIDYSRGCNGRSIIVLDIVPELLLLMLTAGLILLLSPDVNNKQYWRCSCGAVNKNAYLFCANCGKPKK